MAYLFLHLIMDNYTHLLLFLSPDRLIFGDMIISRIYSLDFLFNFCFSLTKANTLNAIDLANYRIGSTPTILSLEKYKRSD